MDAVFQIVGVALTIAGLCFAYLAWKSKQLRKDEVLAWALESIDVFQRTYMVLSDVAATGVVDEFTADLRELRARSSTQTDRGRMFFRNVVSDWGKEKPAAYRGLRPKVLDCLVANCRICDYALNCESIDYQYLPDLTSKHSRAFVSLVQAEIGRTHQPKSGAELAGHHVDIAGEVRAAKQQS
jgi:hypothetical protein